MMNRWHSFSLAMVAVGCIALLAGCGGASHTGNPTASGAAGTSPTQAQARGQVSLTIKWPAVPAATPGAKPRLVPEASQSVTIALSAGGQAVGTPQTVARPSGQTTSTATFTDVPSGSVTVTASAFPTADGSGTALATGSVVVSVTPGTPAQASVTMGSTIDHLGITPANPSVAVGATTPLTATAYDAAGDVVLTTASKLTWASSDTTKATVDASSGVVTGVAAGTPTITVTDSESGKTGSITVSVGASGGSASAAYTITDLGVLPGSDDGAFSYANGINDSGQVVGRSGSPSSYHAFVWSQANGMHELGPNSGSAISINNSGQVTGYEDNPYNYQAVRWNADGTSIFLPPAFDSNGAAINSSGQIAGSINYSDDSVDHPYMWDATGTQGSQVGPGSGSSFGNGINDNGVIVGQEELNPFSTNYSLAAFRYDASGYHYLNTTGYTGGSAQAVNNSDIVVGRVFNSTGEYIARWDAAGNLTLLGSGMGNAINQAGVVVGSDANGNIAEIATTSGGVVVLSTLVTNGQGWTLNSATGINSSGQICGNGTINGQSHAFLLTPVASGQARHR